VRCEPSRSIATKPAQPVAVVEKNAEKTPTLTWIKAAEPGLADALS
jgi:hypothetical protein